MKNIFLIVLLISLGVISYLSFPAAYAEPVREAGLSAHWTPERVAFLGEEVQAGFITTFDNEQNINVYGKHCATATDLISYFKSFPASIQNNGIWLVVTHPDAYSPEEHKMKEDLIKACQQYNIPLFICRGSELPDGWKQYSPAPR